MKTTIYLFLPLLILFTGCEKEEAVTAQDPKISEILISSSSDNQPKEITIKIQKPTPCHRIEVETQTSGTTINYNMVVTAAEGEVACIQVVKEENVTVLFTPSVNGTYTLNFFINGELQETREIVASE